MESVRFVGIDIKVLAWDEDASAVVAEEWLEVPPAVDAHNVEDYVVGRFGEPVDVAMGRSDGVGEIVMGWVFDREALHRLDLPSEGLELMVVPFVRFPDGTRRELFDYTAQLHREFAALVAPLAPDAAPLDEPAPLEVVDRLEHERLDLVGTDRETVELQVGGWLHRMVREGWTYLVLEITGTGRYVQFLTHDGSWLRGEVVGDRYLGAEQAMTAEERERLADVGWNSPGSHDDDCGNHWVDWGDEHDRDPSLPEATVRGRDIDEAARFAAAALCDVFGFDTPTQVAITCGHASHAQD